MGVWVKGAWMPYLCAVSLSARTTAAPPASGAGEPRPFTASEALTWARVLGAADAAPDSVRITKFGPGLAATLRAYAEATGEKAVARALDEFSGVWRTASEADRNRWRERAKRAIRAALKMEG